MMSHPQDTSSPLDESGYSSGFGDSATSISAGKSKPNVVTISISYSLDDPEIGELHVQAPKGARPFQVIRQGMIVLRAERDALRNCPAHKDEPYDFADGLDDAAVELVKHLNGRVAQLSAALASAESGIGVAVVPLTGDEKQAQATRCACHGADDYCPCQNTPDRETIKARAALLPGLPDAASEPLRFIYRNWRGDVAERAVRPLRIWYGSTEWHPAPQWLLRAIDLDKGAERDFAVGEIVGLAGNQRDVQPDEADHDA